MTKSDPAILYLYQGLKNQLVSNHEFFVEQSKTRLFDQFNDLNIQSEAQGVAEETWEGIEKQYDPEKHDLLEFSELADSIGFERYELLEEMRDHVRLGIMISLFHAFEKSLKDWMSKDFFSVFRSEKVKRAIWTASLEELYTLLKHGGVNVRVTQTYKRLREYQLIVNVCKHGEGKSFDELRRVAPQYVRPVDDGGFYSSFPDEFFDYTCLKVSMEDFDRLTGAIPDFWNALPTYIYSSEFRSYPQWLEDAAK
ncbi:MAG: hypothetical protein AAGA12_02825 [Pseudomonadota bacterium]